MNTLKKSLIMVIVLVSVVGSVEAQVVTYTTETIDDFVALAGSRVCKQTALAFTFDEQPKGDVWAIVISERPVGSGQYIFNGYGWSGGPGDAYFQFVTRGTIDNPLVPASLIIFILNDDDEDLFIYNSDTRRLTVGLGDDITLGHWCASIDGEDFGDISPVRFDYYDGRTTLSAVEMHSYRSAPYEMGDLVDLAHYWFSDCDGPDNSYCDGMDINGDGVVNLLDFARLAEGWLGEFVGSNSIAVEVAVESVSVGSVSEEEVSVKTSPKKKSANGITEIVFGDNVLDL